jgi:hypothetical protein
MSNLSQVLADQYAVNDRYARDGGLGHFLDSTVINSSPEPTRFGEVAEPWQRDLIAPKIDAVQGLAGYTNYSGPLSFLSILPRGHDKSSLEGRICNFLLSYSRRKIEGYIVAADRDQGRLVIDAMRDEAELNPWYSDYLEFSKYSVVGPGGKVEVVPADAGSAFGFRGNLYVVDEVTHWKDGVGQKVWEAIVSGREKRKGSLLIGIMNAWVKGSWQEELLIDPAFADPEEWVTFYKQGQLASWMTPERVAKVRKLLPAAVAMRVFDNIPIDPVVESGYLTPEMVAKCIDPDARTHPDPIRGYSYVLSVDYGPTKDRTVLVRMHMDERGVVVIDEMTVWEGKNFPTGRVPLHKVDEWLDRNIKRFKPEAVVIDPYEMENTIQRLQGKWDAKRTIPFKPRAGLGNMELAMTLRALVMTRMLVWRPDAGFIAGAKDDSFYRELIALVTRVMNYGWRLDHTAGKHDDRAVAVGMGLVECVKHRYVPYTKPGGEFLRGPRPDYPFTAEPSPMPGLMGINPLVGR